MANIMKMGATPGYLGSWDVEECPNREITLTIDHIVDEKLIANGQSEVCTVIHWKEQGVAPMVCNVCNKKTLAKLYKTTDTEKLRGKVVIIGVEKVRAFGDIHDALRIRPRVPQIRAAAVSKCESCGKDIAPLGKMNSEQVAAYTKEKYGKALCSECAMAIANAQTAPEVQE